MAAGEEESSLVMDFVANGGGEKGSFRDGVGKSLMASFI